MNLGWKLAAERPRAGRRPGLLDTFQSERHPVGELLMRNTRAQTKLYLSGEEMSRCARSCRNSSRTSRWPATWPARSPASTCATTSAPAAIRGSACGCARHPAQAHRRQPRHRRDLLKPARGVLSDPRGGRLLRAARHRGALGDRVDTVTGDWAEGEGAASDAPHALLVRPDGYIAWAARDEAGLQEALERWFEPLSELAVICRPGRSPVRGTPRAAGRSHA